MKKFLPITAGAGVLACSLVIASPAHAIDCDPATVWTSDWIDADELSLLQQYEVDPETGDLEILRTVMAPMSAYGDIAIETEDGDLWATDFLPNDPTDHGFFRIDPEDGQEITRLPLSPTLAASTGDAEQLNALSFRPDGRIYTAAGFSRDIWVVNPADGTWTQPDPAVIPELEPGWEDNFSAGDFITLEDDRVLGVANAIEDLDDVEGTIVSYLVLFDFEAHTSAIVGRFDQWVNGLAQSSHWGFLAGQDGDVFRIDLDTLPTDHDPARDLTAFVAIAHANERGDSGRWFGIASAQDSGVCVAAAEDDDTPRLPDTGPADVAPLAIAATVLLGAGIVLRMVRRRSTSARD